MTIKTKKTKDPASKPRSQARVPDAPDRFLGCLLGGAVGDALGAAVEFIDKAQITAKFGPNGITDYAPAFGGLGRITDDTQMTLFTAEGLLRTWVRGCMRGLASHVDVTAYAYQRWLWTQGELRDYDTSVLSGWLVTQPALYARRAPGATCLAALKESRIGEAARNDSKGCGGVMRVAPVGLYMARMAHATFDDVFDMAVELAGLTHGHPTGQLAAGAFAALVFGLARGQGLQQALDEALKLLARHKHHDETLRALRAAVVLAASDVPHEQAIGELGQGWVAEEALAIATYCALVSQGFEHGVVLAVNHDGDSDSTGSMTGQLLGALLGVTAIPERWLQPLELRDVIAEVALDLYTYPDWTIGEYAPITPEAAKILARYPGY